MTLFASAVRASSTIFSLSATPTPSATKTDASRNLDCKPMNSRSTLENTSAMWRVLMSLFGCQRLCLIGKTRELCVPIRNR